MSDVANAGESPRRPTSISDDLLIGGAAISEFLFGTPEKRRKVYHLARTSRLPHTKIGSQLSSTRTALAKWTEPK